MGSAHKHEPKTHAQALPYKITADSAIAYMLRQLELPRGPPSSTEKLRLLAQSAICRWTACRPWDTYLVQFVVELRGASAELHSVQPSWPCSDTIDRAVLSKLPETYASEFAAARRIADASVALTRRNVRL